MEVDHALRPQAYSADPVADVELVVHCVWRRGGGGGDDDETLQPYASFTGYGPLILHIVNETNAAITNVSVRFSLPDNAYSGGMVPIAVSCAGSQFTPATFVDPLASDDDYYLSVPSMQAGQDCSAEVPVLTVGTVRVPAGKAIADGGLSNQQDFEFTYKAP